MHCVEFMHAVTRMRVQSRWRSNSDGTPDQPVIPHWSQYIVLVQYAEYPPFLTIKSIHSTVTRKTHIFSY